MLKIDKVQLEIAINGNPARKELHELEQYAVDLRKKIKGAADPQEQSKLRKDLADTEKDMEKLRHTIGLTGMTTDELSKRLKTLQTIFKKLEPNTPLWHQYKNEIDSVKKRQTELSGSIVKTGSSFDTLKTKTVVAYAAIAASVGTAFSFFKKLISVNSDFEKYEAVLRNTFGSQEKARESMSMLQKTAALLPVSLNELTDGYVKLVNRGFVPTQQELIKLSDLASSQGKSLNMFIEAVLDAQTGEFERLKEFGIKAKQEGDKVTFTFRGQTETVKKTDEAIKNYLLKLGSLPSIAGSSASVMNTLQGKISNLGDSWDRMLVAMGEAGLGGATKKLIGYFGGVIDKITDWIAIPQSEKLREEQFEINNLVHSIMSVNDNQTVRNGLIADLQQKYPDFLKNLNIEKVTNEELKNRLSEVNEEYIKRIRIAVVKEDIEKNEKNMTEVLREQRTLVRMINGDYDRLVKNKNDNATLDEKIQAIGESSTDVMVGMMLTSQKQDLLAGLYKKQYINLQQKQNDLNKEYNQLLVERKAIAPEEEKPVNNIITNTTAEKKTEENKKKLKNNLDYMMELADDEIEKQRLAVETRENYVNDLMAIADEEINKQAEIVQAKEDSLKELEKLNDDELQDLEQTTKSKLLLYKLESETIKRQHTANIKAGMSEVDAAKKRDDALQDLSQRTVQYYSDQLTSSLENVKTVQEGVKAMGNIIRQEIKQWAAESVMAAVKNALVSVPFPFNIAIAAAAGAATQLAFNAAIPEFYEGYTGDGNPHDPAFAIVHKGEDIIPNRVVRTPEYQMNIQPMIRSMMYNTKGYYDGYVSPPSKTSTTAPSFNSQSDPELKAMLANLNAILSNGIKAQLPWDQRTDEELNKRQTNLQKLKDKASIY